MNELTDAVERRSPRDLSAIDPLSTPAEVQPLVIALNRLFGLVNAQAEGQRRFVADAAHQLRTPLAGLQAQVEAWAQAARLSKTKGGEGTITLPADKIIKLRSATRHPPHIAVGQSVAGTVACRCTEHFRTTHAAGGLEGLVRVDAGTAP